MFEKAHINIYKLNYCFTNTIEIKQNFHLLIDSIENEKLLINFYDLIKKRFSAKEGQLWNKLTNQEQDELLLSLEESKNPENLISHEEMKKKHNIYKLEQLKIRKKQYEVLRLLSK